jgi:hypothetical protein
MMHGLMNVKNPFTEDNRRRQIYLQMYKINSPVCPEGIKTTTQFFSHSPQRVSMLCSLCLIDAGNYRMSPTPYRNEGTMALQQDGTPPHYPTNICTRFGVLFPGKWLDS